MTDHHEDRRLQGITTIAEALLESLLEEWSANDDLSKEIDGRAGGYLTICDSATGEELLPPTRIGTVNEAKVAKYEAFCQEKAGRLLLKMRSDGHVSSRQSRRPDEDQWGGAILIVDENLVFSFSGLPELADEAFMVRLAWEMATLRYSPDQGVTVAEFAEPRTNDYLAAA